MDAIGELHPEVARRVLALLAWARAEGVRPTVTSTYRSISEQRRLYERWLARGRTGLPVAVPGTSTHNYRVGVDIALANEHRDRAFFSAGAEYFGLVWAGPSDRVHYDPFGRAAWRHVLAGLQAA